MEWHEQEGEGAARRRVWTPSELVADARVGLEQRYGSVWLEGEIAGLSRPASGHCYFVLKDAGAQVRCALFRQRAAGLGFRPADGERVLVRARVGLYEPRGEFQLVVEFMEPAGEGLLRLALRQLRARLAAEGLFDPARKRPLPARPAAIGIVTSTSGAALADVLAVLGRRAPAIPVVIYPAQVQGAEAPAALAHALGRAAARAEVDVLLLVRGGGSAEDLVAFNDEAVVRQVAAAPMPVVSGVGHETDWTLVDEAADRRAPTPSVAAELAAPDERALAARFLALARRGAQAMMQRLLAARLHQTRLAARLIHPERRLERLAQRLDELAARLGRAMADRRLRLGMRLGVLGARLVRRDPRTRLAAAGVRFGIAREALQRAMAARTAQAAGRLAQAARALGTVSPLATLGRGYALARDAEGRVLRDAATVPPGTTFELTLARGALACVVTHARPAGDDA